MVDMFFINSHAELGEMMQVWGPGKVSLLGGWVFMFRGLQLIMVVYHLYHSCSRWDHAWICVFYSIIISYSHFFKPIIPTIMIRLTQTMPSFLFYTYLIYLEGRIIPKTRCLSRDDLQD